jgi:thiol-disulfide isomerase/thioredoxin
MWKLVFVLMIAMGLPAVVGCGETLPELAIEAPVAEPSPVEYAWEGEGRHVLMFSSTTCQACVTQRPLVEGLRAHGIEVHIVDIDAHPEIAEQYGVTQLPTYLTFEDGNLLATVFSWATLIKVLKFALWIVLL